MRKGNSRSGNRTSGIFVIEISPIRTSKIKRTQTVIGRRSEKAAIDLFWVGSGVIFAYLFASRAFSANASHVARRNVARPRSGATGDGS